MISSYIVDCNIMTDDCPFYCCIFWGTCIYQVTDFAPEQGRKADSPHLCGRSCFFCLAYEVKPRNRPHISSLSPAGAELERAKRDECACGAAGGNLQPAESTKRHTLSPFNSQNVFFPFSFIICIFTNIPLFRQIDP